MKNLFLDISDETLYQALHEYNEWAFNTGVIPQGGILKSACDKYKALGMDIHIMERDLLYAGSKRWINGYNKAIT